MEQEETQQNIKSSHTESRPSLRLVDVVVNLLRRDRVKEAVDLQVDAMILATMNGLDIEDVMRMSVKDVAALSLPQQAPYIPQVEGYDNVWYGDAAFEHRG